MYSMQTMWEKMYWSKQHEKLMMECETSYNYYAYIVNYCYEHLETEKVCKREQFIKYYVEWKGGGRFCWQL